MTTKKLLETICKTTDINRLAKVFAKYFKKFDYHLNQLCEFDTSSVKEFRVLYHNCGFGFVQEIYILWTNGQRNYSFELNTSSDHSLKIRCLNCYTVFYTLSIDGFGKIISEPEIKKFSDSNYELIELLKEEYEEE